MALGTEICCLTPFSCPLGSAPPRAGAPRHSRRLHAPTFSPGRAGQDRLPLALFKEQSETFILVFQQTSWSGLPPVSMRVNQSLAREMGLSLDQLVSRVLQQRSVQFRKLERWFLRGREEPPTSPTAHRAGENPRGAFHLRQRQPHHSVFSFL